MECRGCKDKCCGEAICWTAAGGGISTAVGGLVPVILMAWNCLLQSLVSCPCCLAACATNKGCLCGCTQTFSHWLAPVWCCSLPYCACGSCASLGTVWTQIFTFAGFAGFSTTTWYVFGADVAIILGMVACLVALVWWGVMCVTEGNPETDSKNANGESDPLTGTITGEMKF